MNLLSVENISKAFGERVILENISFGINKDQKIAFIAKNGTGKTTLLRLVLHQNTDFATKNRYVFLSEILPDRYQASLYLP